MSSQKSPPARRVMSHGQAAAFLDITPRTLENWRKKGCPVIERGGRDPLYDVLAVLRWKHTRRDDDLSQPRDVPRLANGDPDFSRMTYRQQGEWADAQLKLLDLQKARQGLHSAEDAAACARQLVDAMTRHLRALPDQLEQAGVRDPRALDHVRGTVDSTVTQLEIELEASILRDPGEGDVG